MLSADKINQLFVKSEKIAWEEILSILCQALIPLNGKDAKESYREIEKNVEQIDYLLSSSAWNLWNNFQIAAKGSEYVKDFWRNMVTPKSVLILDGLSIREINPIVTALAKSGLKIKKIALATSEIPSETDAYARAIGVAGRAALTSGGVPSNIGVIKEQTYIDHLDLPFDEVTKVLKNERDIFLWHSWPDSALHGMDRNDPLNRLINNVKEEASSEKLVALIKKLCCGRELLITSDHGYCDTSGFRVANDEQNSELRKLGHRRAKKSSNIQGDVFGMSVPPITLEAQGTSNKHTYRVAVGRVRPQDRGFPGLTHGGFSLMECVVPLLHIIEEKNSDKQG